MKKKLLSLVVMVAVLVTMFSTTVFAADSPTTAKQVKDSMEKAADWYAGQLDKKASSSSAADIIVQAAYPLFLIERTGTKSENVTNLENYFIDAVKENIAANNKVVNGEGHESIDVYANVIMTLLALGKNPENFEGKDIVKMYSDFLETSPTTSIVFFNGSPYNSINIAAVDLYYKDKTEVISEELALIDEAIIRRNYVKVQIDGSDFINRDNAGNYGVDLNALGISVDEWGSVHATNEALEALNSSTSPYAGNFYLDYGDYLDVYTTIVGTGFYNGGFGIDNDAKMIMGFFESTDKTKTYLTYDHLNVTVNEVLNASLDKIAASIDDEGLVDGWGYGPNADSTGLALAAMSTFGKTADAAKLYSGLVTLQNEDGGFAYNPGDGISNLGATKDAIEGLVAYYYMIGGLGYMLDLSVNPTEAAENNQVEMTTPANATWSAASGEWFTFSSPLPLSELLDVQIDGKSVFGGYISTDENGVMTFAAIGGGTIRVWEGSTYVSFSPEFMSTLGNGEHTVRIQSTTGFAESSFTVQAATPSTGDTANILMYIAIAGVGAAVVTAAIVSKKRSSECE